MKIVAIVPNPNTNDFQRAALACHELNTKREYGEVRPVLFNRQGRAVLAFGWKQSALPNFSQEWLDNHKSATRCGPEDHRHSFISIFERALGRELRAYGDDFVLDEMDIQAIREIDSNPSRDISACCSDARAVDIELPSTAGWHAVEQFLEEDVAPTDGESRYAWLYEVPSIHSATLTFKYYVPVVAFMVDDTREMYQLVAPTVAVTNYAFHADDYYGPRYCHRLFKLQGNVVSEVPTLDTTFCACGHVMGLETADGSFRFHMHPGQQEDPTMHGFHYDAESKKRFTVALSAQTISARGI